MKEGEKCLYVRNIKRSEGLEANSRQGERWLSEAGEEEMKGRRRGGCEKKEEEDPKA